MIVAAWHSRTHLRDEQNIAPSQAYGGMDNITRSLSFYFTGRDDYD